MTTLEQWAIKHGVCADALAELRTMWGHTDHATESHPSAGKSEAWAQSMVMLETMGTGCRLWRNNVGACLDQRGRMIRYGLANESKRQNERIKSSDLIGIKRVTITPEMVGSTIGQFVAREIKKPGWHWSGSQHEKAQLAFLQFVLAYGGDASFADGPGSLS